VIKGNSGLFVAMPSRKRPDGQHQDLAHPINDTTRKYLTQIVLDEYDRELGRPQQAVRAQRVVDREFGRARVPIGRDVGGTAS